jgi:lipopolysaccharide transport system permease protein
MNLSRTAVFVGDFFSGPLFPLAIDIALRDLEAKYKRSFAGLLWLVLTPLGMLALYWMVFGVILNVSWQDPSTSEKVGFVLPFFIGLVFYLFFSDVVISSANLFVSKRNYVIKSSFPLWVLWLANLIRAATHGLVNLGLLTVVAFNYNRFYWDGVLWAFAIVASGLLFIAASSLLVSCIAPFIGDISEAAGLALRVLFYTAPVTYPLEIVPTNYRVFLWFNPLTHIIEPVRRAIVYGKAPDLTLMMLFIVISLLLFFLSLWVFKRTKGVIPDVV